MQLLVPKHVYYLLLKIGGGGGLSMLLTVSLSTKDKYIYLVQFLEIIITYFINTLIPENSCTQICSNLRGSLIYIFVKEISITPKRIAGDNVKPCA